MRLTARQSGHGSALPGKGTHLNNMILMIRNIEMRPLSGPASPSGLNPVRLAWGSHQRPQDQRGS